MTEGELELEISSKNSNDARLVLGRLLIEGTSDKIKKNEKKGFNWVKEASKNGHLGAKEYKVYYEVRYDKQPNMKKIFAALNEVVDKSKSTRACNMLAEFNQVQDKKEGTAAEAAKYYSMSADQGCTVGTHWMGVFYHLGIGVPKNVEKALVLLRKASKEGNG